MIRPIEERDAAEWLRMRQLLWPTALLEDLSREVQGFFGHGTAASMVVAVFVDATDDRLSGFLELSVRAYAEGCSGPTPYVEGWYVDADARRQGVGTALVRAAAEWALARGYDELASDALLKNGVGHAAHRALGFDEVERVVHFRKRLVTSD